MGQRRLKMGRQKWVGDERKNKENGEEWRSKQWRVKTEERVMKIEEGELSQGRGWIKSKFFFLQLSYNTILHLGWYCSTIVNFFTIGRLDNGSFWSFDAKIYQHMACERPNVNAFINWWLWDLDATLLYFFDLTSLT